MKLLISILFTAITTINADAYIAPLWNPPHPLTYDSEGGYIATTVEGIGNYDVMIVIGGKGYVVGGTSSNNLYRCESDMLSRYEIMFDDFISDGRLSMAKHMLQRTVVICTDRLNPAIPHKQYSQVENHKQFGTISESFVDLHTRLIDRYKKALKYSQGGIQ